MLLPALAALLALSLWSISAVGAQLRCVDASRTAARALARGESAERALAAARALAPRGASVDLSRNGNLAVVTVQVRYRLPGFSAASGAGLDLESTAAATVER